MKKIKITFKINHVKEGKQTSRNIFKNAKRGTIFHKNKKRYDRKNKKIVL
jgi:hypothetical protein